MNVILWLFLLAVGLSLFTCYLFESEEKSPEAQERKRQEEKKIRNEINSAIKRRFNIDFSTSLNINDTVAIDKTRDLVFLAYKKNTLDYVCVIPATSIYSYDLEPEYSSANTSKRAAVGALIGGSAGAIVGATSAQKASFTGNYLLGLHFKINSSYADTYIKCHKEDGQKIIRYLDSKTGFSNK